MASTHNNVVIANPSDIKDLASRDIMEQMLLQMIYQTQLLLRIANELSDQNLTTDDLEE